MGKSTISMVIFNSYVKLPEGISICIHLCCCFLEILGMMLEKSRDIFFKKSDSGTMLSELLGIF